MAILVNEDRLRKLLEDFIDDASWLESTPSKSYNEVEKELIDRFIKACKTENTS